MRRILVSHWNVMYDKAVHLVLLYCKMTVALFICICKCKEGQQETVYGNDVKRRWIGRGGYKGGEETII